MNALDRKSLNLRCRKLAHGVLRMDEETYRTIVLAIDDKSDGHVSRCDDESANLVYLALRRLADRHPQSTSTRSTNAGPEKKIAKLGYLLGWSWRDIAAFTLRQVGKKSTRSCNAAELTKVINGMLQIVNDRLSAGTLTLPHPDLEDFLKHTQQPSSKEVV